MAIAGSISIDQLLEDLDISTVLNDVQRLELHPFTRPEAEALLQSLAATQGLKSWTGETIGHVLDRLDDLFPSSSSAPLAI